MKTQQLYSNVKTGDESTQPFRVVLHQNEKSEWVTHLENMVRYSNGEHNEKVHRDFYWGHYFGQDYQAALKDYRARCEKYGI
jgi:hypothetical protein